jgi:hypothetical protein
MGQLPGQAGLAHAGLADDRDDLAVTGAGALKGLAELVEFGVAADEAGEAAGGNRVKSGTDSAGAGELEDLDGLDEASHRD